MASKDYKTYNELLAILISRGVASANPVKAIEILKQENYYNVINGYKKWFLQSTSPQDVYIGGTTLEEIYALFCFDRQARMLFLSEILRIENYIKSAIAHEFSKVYGHTDYLKVDNFYLGKATERKEERQKKYSAVCSLIGKIHSDISYNTSSRSKNASLSHYSIQHGSIPLWILVNVLTLGRISKFYLNMKIIEKQSVASYFKISETELGTMLDILSDFRNICAHDERLFCFRSRASLQNNFVPVNLNIKNPHMGKKDMLALLIIIKQFTLTSEFEEVKNKLEAMIASLATELKVISIQKIMDEMGLPSNWKTL